MISGDFVSLYDVEVSFGLLYNEKWQSKYF